MIRRILLDVAAGAVIAAIVGACLWGLSLSQWRDKYGRVHYSADNPAPWKSPYWWDELEQGPMPGRHDFD